MCGIVGVLNKTSEQKRFLGRTLLAMLQALSCRGPDSAGVALFGPPGDWRLRLVAPAAADAEAVGAALRDLGGAVVHQYPAGVYDGRLSAEPDAAALEGQLREALPGVEVICLGRRLELFKQVGSPRQLEEAYHVGG